MLGWRRAPDVRVRTCGDGSVFAFNARRLLRRDADTEQPFVELRPMDGGARGIIDVQCGDAGAVWIGTWSGMVRFDAAGGAHAAAMSAAPVMQTVRMDVDDDHTAWLGLLPADAELPHFRQIRFEYASPSHFRGVCAINRA